MDDFTVKGAEDFLKLSKALKAAGHTQLRKELHAQMRKAAKAAMPKTQEALAEALPSGLKNRSKVRQVVKVKTGRDAGVTIAVPYGKHGRNGLGASNAHMLNARGQLRHPVYADPDKTSKDWRWVNQSVPGTGWFDKTLLDEAPALRKALEAAMEAVARTIVKGV